MNSEPVRVGLAGCGRIAQAVHLGVLQRLREFKLVAIADTDEAQRTQAGAWAPRATHCGGLDEMLERPDLEAVVVCLPNPQHASAADAVLGSGRHLYLEKPLASNYEQAKRLADTWQHTDLVAMMGFNYRFHPLYLELKAQVQSKALGELREGRTRFTTARGALPDWKKTRSSGGGALLDLASHHLDLLYFLLGRHPVEVACTLRSEHTEEDTAALTVQYAGGPVITSDFDLYSGNSDWIELTGFAKRARVDRLQGLSVNHTSHPPNVLSRALDVIASPYARKKWWNPPWEASYEIALAHFGSVVRGRTFSGPGLADGLENLALIQACEVSARIGSPVAITSA